MKRVYAIAALLTGAGALAAPHPFTADDLVRLHRVSEPAVSPNGKQVAFTVRETDLSADRGRTDVWVRDIAGNAEPRRLTSHAENDSSPAWSADNAYVYFLSTRSGSNQVWRIALDGGEAQQVTHL